MKCVQFTSLCMVLLVAAAMSVTAEVPQLIDFQGRLTDSVGIPVADNLYELCFCIHDDSLAGVQLWEETQNVAVTAGLFSVLLGSTAAWPDSLFSSHPDLYITVEMTSPPGVSTPRIRLTSTPFAFHALTAEALSTPTPGDCWTDDGPVVRLTDTSDNVGIGTTIPTHKLSVIAASNAIYGEVTGGAIGQIGVHGKAVAAGGEGVRGIAEGDDGRGLYGRAFGVDAFGVYGRASGTSGTGVYGEIDANTTGIGVYGKAISAGSEGVRGIAEGTDGRGLYGRAYGVDAFGVYGRASGTSGTGVYGEIDATTTGIGVYGKAVSAGSEGVRGISEGTEGRGVYGRVFGTDAKGVYGLASGASGTGVYGELDASTTGIGVYGHSLSVGSEGVRGIAEGNQGRGVYGRVFGDDAFAIYGRASGLRGRAIYGEANQGGGVGIEVEATGSSGVGIIARGATNGMAAKFYGNVAIYSNADDALIMQLGEGLDYAEGFHASDPDEILPGTVVSIDPATPGRLMICATPYDTKVAGIVAGANSLGSGVRLGAGKFDLDVALAGRVYCNVDATSQGIEPGDLLTTSILPGYAMKATDLDRAQGAILGKAMESLEQGQTGQVLVLVTLQ